MTGNATPPPPAHEDVGPELDWLADLEDDLRRIADRPRPQARRRGLLGRLLDPEEPSGD